MPAGRPSAYTEDLATMICDRIADGESLHRSVTTAIFQIGDGPRWFERDAEFASKVHARARVPSGRDGRAHSNRRRRLHERDGPS